MSGESQAGSVPVRPGASRATRATVRFLAVCNVIGFGVLFGSIAIGTAGLRWFAGMLGAPLPALMARFLELPGWTWIAGFAAGSALVAAVHRAVRNPVAAVLVQTVIGIGQIAAVMVCGIAWIVCMLRLPR